MAFIEPMHHNKPNITYFLSYFVDICVALTCGWLRLRRECVECGARDSEEAPTTPVASSVGNLDIFHENAAVDGHPRINGDVPGKDGRIGKSFLWEILGYASCICEGMMVLLGRKSLFVNEGCYGHDVMMCREGEQGHDLNPLWTELFWQKTFFFFVWYSEMDSRQVVQVHAGGRQELNYLRESVSRLLMPCWCKEPGHQQRCYWFTVKRNGVVTELHCSKWTPFCLFNLSSSYVFISVILRV